MSSNLLFAQLMNYKHHIQAKYSMGNVSGVNYSSLGFTLEWQTKRKIGFLYNLDFIHRQDNIRQVHASVGSLLGPPIFGIGLVTAFTKDSIRNSDLDFGAGGIAIGILIMLLPDGISYHIPLSYKLDLEPYVNFLGVDHVRDRNIPKNYFKYACSLGAKLNYWTNKRFTFSAYAETRGVASYGWSLGGGLGIGYSFNKRTKEELEK